MHAEKLLEAMTGTAIGDDERTGGARERVPAALAVDGDVVDEREVLVHRPRPAPELHHLH